MRTSLRLGLAACLLLSIFWITSEIRGLNSRWMPIDDANLTPTKPTPAGSDGGKQNLVDVGGVASISGLPLPGKPISSPVAHGYSVATDAPSVDEKSKTNDPTKLPEDKILVMGKLKKQNTDWVKKGLPEYVKPPIFFCSATIIGGIMELIIISPSVGNMRYIPSTTDPLNSTLQRRKAMKPMQSSPLSSTTTTTSHPPSHSSTPLAGQKITKKVVKMATRIRISTVRVSTTLRP